MSEALSENANKLLGSLVFLGENSPEGVVQDNTLWQAAGLDYEAYVDAARELVDEGDAENPTNASDFPSLTATPKGMERLRSL